MSLFNTQMWFSLAHYNYSLTTNGWVPSFLSFATSDDEPVVQGVVTMFGGDPPKPTTATENLPRVLRQVREYSASFSERAQSIVHSLQTHPDLDCRFLAVRLSFSDYYRSKGGTQSRDGEQ